jgi:predicted DNA-binding protein (MmcQ/YjbR family)
MTLESIRNFATSLPHVTEKVQWGDDLVFKVGGKMFCVAYLGVPTHLSFRPSDEHRFELLEVEGVIPAPYMARAGWVSVRQMGAVNAAEIKKGIRASYDYYFAKLPKKTQAALQASKNKIKNGKSKINNQRI